MARSSSPGPPCASRPCFCAAAPSWRLSGPPSIARLGRWRVRRCGRRCRISSSVPLLYAYSAGKRLPSRGFRVIRCGSKLLELFELLDAHAWTAELPVSGEGVKSLAHKDLYDTGPVAPGVLFACEQ